MFLVGKIGFILMKLITKRGTGGPRPSLYETKQMILRIYYALPGAASRGVRHAV
jgi:hypothetical protein